MSVSVTAITNRKASHLKKPVVGSSRTGVCCLATFNKECPWKNIDYLCTKTPSWLGVQRNILFWLKIPDLIATDKAVNGIWKTPGFVARNIAGDGQNIPPKVSNFQLRDLVINIWFNYHKHGWQLHHRLHHRQSLKSSNKRVVWMWYETLCTNVNMAHSFVWTYRCCRNVNRWEDVQPLGRTSSAPPHEKLSSYRYNLKYITSENVYIIRTNETELGWHFCNSFAARTLCCPVAINKLPHSNHHLFIIFGT